MQMAYSLGASFSLTETLADPFLGLANITTVSLLALGDPRSGLLGTRGNKGERSRSKEQNEERSKRNFREGHRRRRRDDTQSGKKSDSNTNRSNAEEGADFHSDFEHEGHKVDEQFDTDSDDGGSGEADTARDANRCAMWKFI